MNPRLSWLFNFAILLCLAATAAAQDTASITGTVSDSSGATIANAQVTVDSTEQGIHRTSTTNGSGDYLFASLPIGAYNVTAVAPGFKKLETRGIVLRVGEKARNDISMQVGAGNTEISVEGASVAQVETQSSDLAGTVSGKEVTQLELNGRNFSQLITLVPGVTNQTGQDEGQVGVGGSVAFSVNGGRTEYNNWEMDGGNVMDNGSNGTLNVYPSIDAIGEVKVLTSNYGAQYGRNGSGTVEVETKSGTSSFHGDAYEFVRNDAFNSPAYFQNGVVPPYKKNDFGYTIGGPVTIPGLYNENRQKTFFFWSQEWRRDRVPYSFNQLVPSAAERAGDFSDLCPNLNSGTAGDFSDCPTINGIPTPNLTGVPGYNPSDPNVQALLALIPLPNAGSPGAAQYNTTVTQPTNWREELIKFDHNLTDKERLTVRYIHDSWSTLNPVPLWTNQGSFPTIGTDFKGPGLSLVTRLSSTFSPTLLNEFVFSYTTDHIILNNTGAWKRPSDTTFGGLFPTNGNGIMPGINLVDQGTAYGNGSFGEDPGYIPNGPYNSNPTYGFRDNVSKIVGKHNLQFGAYLEAAQKNEFGGELGAGSVPGYLSFDPSSSSTTSGNPFADLLLGNIASFGQQNQFIKYYNRYKIFEPYFQDDWHATTHLTVSLGLRLSLLGTYRERYHKAYNFEPSAYQAGVTTLNSDGSVNNLILSNGLPNGIVQCGVGSSPAGCMKGHLFNPAPRIGFAFDPRGNGKMAIRGGYGVFFEHTNGNEADTESLENSPPLAFAAQQNNIVGYTNIGGSSGSTAPQFPLNVTAIPTKAVWPYVQQWHLDVQQQFVGNMVATVSYVGSKGTHLGRQTNYNQLLPVPLAQNPFQTGEAMDCSLVTSSGGTTPSGAPIVGQALTNANVACGNLSADPFRPYAGYGDITHLQNQASSIYHALQVAVRRSYKGLDLNFAYTYSHSIDDASDRFDSSFVDSYNPSANRANSSFDQRHVLNFGYVWDLPFFREPGVIHSVLGGWQYSGITTYNTGSPFSVRINSDNAGVANGINGSAFADIVGNPRAGVVNTPLDGFGPLYYNPNAFAAPRGLTFGNSGRNILRNPNRINFDMALFKHFAFTERMGLEFRAEAFNVFNHTEWQGIAGDSGSAANSVGAGTNNLGDPGLFRPNSVHNARVLQLALKFVF